MHPDALIEALKVELAEARDEDHKKQIKAEIERVDKLPRPVAKPEEPETAYEPRRAYLDALKVELGEATNDEHKAAVKAEIKRVEQELDAAEEAEDEPSDEDNLGSKTRDELNELAASLGIEDADKLPNKGAVVDAIRGAQEAANE